MNDTNGAIAPVKGVRVRDVIVQRIRAAVVDGTFAAGTKLPPEHKLASDMGVSRTSVREALRELEAMGLVVSRHGVGAFVCGTNGSAVGGEAIRDLLADRPSMAEFLEVRRLVETHCAALAAQRRSEDEVTALETAVAQMALLRQDPDAYSQADYQFHRLLIRAAQNSIFENIMDAASEPFRRELLLTVRLPGATESSYRYHRRIKDAVLRQKPDLARRAMAEHLSDIEGQLEEVQRLLVSHGG